MGLLLGDGGVMNIWLVMELRGNIFVGFYRLWSDMVGL